MYKQQTDLNDLIGDMEAFEFDAFSSTAEKKRKEK